MKLFPIAFLALRVIEVAFVTTCCCTLKNVSASHASPQSSITKGQDLTNYDYGIDDTNTNNIINRPGNRLLLEQFNVTNGGLSPNNDDQWAQLGDPIKGKATGDLFGSSIATSKSGDFVVIGGPYNDDNGANSGIVQIYKYNKDTEKWGKVGGDILGEKAGDQSGYSVDINDTGDVVIIGSNYNANKAGHARVFRLINGQWYKQGQDLIGSTSQQFGFSVAISSDGGKVIVGAPITTGFVKVYKYNPDTQRWEQLGLGIEAAAANDYFGYSVDMDASGDAIIIGAPYNDGNGKDSGHARVYRIIDGQWVQQGQDLQGKRAGDIFGFKVAISDDGEKVIIGGPRFDVNGTASVGHAQVYESTKMTPRDGSRLVATSLEKKEETSWGGQWTSIVQEM